MTKYTALGKKLKEAVEIIKLYVDKEGHEARHPIHAAVTILEDLAANEVIWTGE